MTLSKNTKNIVIGVVVLVLLFIAYKMFFSSPPEPVLDAGGMPVAGDEVSNDVLSILLKLRSIELDGTFLSSPVLATLKDSEVVLPPEEVGRTNPYAPIGVGRIGDLDIETVIPATTTATSSEETSEEE